MGGLRKYFLLLALLSLALAAEGRSKREDADSQENEDIDIGAADEEEMNCQCGVFMSQQVGIVGNRRGRPRGPPQGDPVVTYDTETEWSCGAGATKQCISKCLDVILKYLARAGPVICGAVDRDVNRENAYLFIKSCGADWLATNFSAGKEFCCRDGVHYKCPRNSPFL
ncbi:hypothetical protein JYU34_011315 [Plutella xylostella]|uniref:Follicle cell protein 3C-1 n=1 Tax=Plutella xylostella TaxID=51655 RepID=A0ABQ7QGM3_PLUXY|nr:hypothetical protein JYU34_011315 [Plutella xylostella]